MKLSDFDYDLPKSFIAQDPVTPRDSSKMMVFDTSTGKVEHKVFRDVLNYLGSNDVLVANRSKVIKARINFSNNGKFFEIFLLKKIGEKTYECIVKPGKKFQVGSDFMMIDGSNAFVVDVKDDGVRVIRFDTKDDPEELGRAPFPPYIDHSSSSMDDYQTVYAKEKGSVASPTAGLHFTDDLVTKLRDKGVMFEKVLLHIGLGTFQPVKTENILDHKMHTEFCELEGSSAINLNEALSDKKRIVAVGTTSVRVLESSFKDGKLIPFSGETDIFIYPGYEWKAVDALMTNFHLPKSTLIMLVASFLEHKGVKNGTKRVLELYEEAKEKMYRFYSFGDSMFIY
ncbi:tRNA preQ1(34) S-adenosylmethionine ribosyltransferase-isomerase QueA [Candidatus Peregrinibacteria bacterium]|jgi:S-adenosylmethionine:tRNA ribosyltransferase-isomerase|nr:tRNA preQ1(34) S-adenosylmethionine ribosyltransferase-isomerase QueA [Candidatus Peregrinibacteria bacterium]MBT4148288.1 tRNA preQ1(34) S-adenosylmethionine ribosyltransferase-isomerase QueA [Candidatus Peregrinibacteria bacterium]MBT4366425.1 tRNA preQ1(34) S-adenosylmethionine ribosyltransferase-isomerase QueA [Candidatus Peregrinibacteria bacterium]MBT4456191.1 tRNA preQ1(34) S-adenosylmethionine ribosyltransferase-isomerase QueA [Candidatus Peregrinibacteria bacterium]